MSSNEDFKWGQDKKEGARKLSSFEKYFGPAELQSGTESLIHSVFSKLLIAPAQWFHDSVLEKTRIPESERTFYHRRYRRVPTIDECYFSDEACKYVLEHTRISFL